MVAPPFTPHSDPDMLKAAVHAVIDGQLVEARRLVRSMDSDDAVRRCAAAGAAVRHIRDQPRTIAAVRGEPSSAVKRAVLLRDGRTCRYCGTPAFEWDVWKLLGQLFPDDFAYKRTGALQDTNRYGFTPSGRPQSAEVCRQTAYARKSADDVLSSSAHQG